MTKLMLKNMLYGRANNSEQSASVQNSCNLFNDQPVFRKHLKHSKVQLLNE